MFLSRISSLVRKVSFVSALVLGLVALPQHVAVAADQCTTNTGSTANAAVSIGASGALVASQMINGIIITEGQIGVMADRILWTETQIGAMSNRIATCRCSRKQTTSPERNMLTLLNYTSMRNALDVHLVFTTMHAFKHV